MERRQGILDQKYRMMNRRNFLTRTGMAMVAVTLMPRKGYTFFMPKAAGADSCVPTTADILGPYYRAGAPMRTNLQVSSDPGIALLFKGVVTDENCNPVPNATVDVWQADTDGAYDNTSPAYEHRGVQQTNSAGEYEFLSIMPGRYLNGSQYRPSHIHFRVTAPGFTELITQLYFEGDPYISIDPWASDPDAALRIVPVNNTGGTDTAIFDITINSVLSVNELGTETKVTAVPQNGLIRIEAEGMEIRNAEVFDIGGRLVNAAYEVNQQQVSFRLPGPAVYFVRLDTGDHILVHKFMAP
jgi:protocatechuate 3,4-dioxygenase beta subunit